MKPLFRKWLGLPMVAAVALSALSTHAATTQVKTLGGGPNQSGPSRTGSVNGDTLTMAKFNNPYGVAVDTNGSLLIADRSNNKIRKITKPGVAGSLTTTFASRLPAPVGLVVDPFNNVFVVTHSDGRLRKLSPSAALLRNVSGLVKPTALALDAAGNVFVTELGGSIKRVAPDNTITIVATGLNKPQGIAVLASGLLAVSESGAHTIRTVNPTNGTSVVIAGGNAAGFSDGDGITARFNQPSGLALAPNGSLVVADRLNHRVRFIDTVGTNHIVSTLYGIPRNEWPPSFPGWVDGPGGLNGTAVGREPVGLTVAKNGTVYVGELYWDLIRQATDTGLSGSGGGSTNGGGGGIVGTNILSFGFASGEVSSDFLAAPGQHWYAPVTLLITPDQGIMSMQFAASATNENAPALSAATFNFRSRMMKLNPQGFYTPIHQNYAFLNSSDNLLGLGWLERDKGTNLYDTAAQDLITYSLSHDTEFPKAGQRIIVGGFGFDIPANAAEGQTYTIRLSRASATEDGIRTDVALSLPADGSLGAGAINAIKRVTIQSRPYVVGDADPFRWFNAGEFGDGYLVNADVMQIFQTAVYFLNRPFVDSDLFDGIDSSGGLVGDLTEGNDLTINNVQYGDGSLNVDDIWVTFRRSLDPSLKWFARHWVNGSRQAFEVPNIAKPGTDPVALPAAAPKSLAKSVPGVRPSVHVSVDDVLAADGKTIEIPVRVQVTPGYPIRVLAMNVSVEALDGSPQITAPIDVSMAPSFGAPTMSQRRGVNNYAGAWLNEHIAGASGDTVLALVTITLPGNTRTRSAYRVHFEHFSASPNGLGLLDKHVTDGLILMSDRSASTWGDGIADAWRLRYFGSIYAPESALGADADGDGMINAIEYQNGTDPTDSTAN